MPLFRSSKPNENDGLAGASVEDRLLEERARNLNRWLSLLTVILTLMVATGLGGQWRE